MKTVIESFFDQPENVKIYSDWISSAATKQFLSFAEEVARPLGMSNPTGDAALYLQGICVGARKLVDFLQHMELFAENNAENTDPESSYGSKEILNDWGVPQGKQKGV